MDILHVETDAVVANEHDDFLVCAIGGTDFNLGLRACAREFDRVREKVHKRKSQHGTISIHSRQCANSPDNIAPLRVLAYVAESFLQKLLQVDRCFLGLGASYS